MASQAVMDQCAEIHTMAVDYRKILPTYCAHSQFLTSVQTCLVFIEGLTLILFTPPWCLIATLSIWGSLSS